MAAIGEKFHRFLSQTDGESGIDNVDPMIAAVSESYDEPVLTTNIEHLERLGVQVESY